VLKINVFGYGALGRTIDFNDLEETEMKRTLIFVLQIYLCLMNTFSNGKSKGNKDKMQTSRTVSRVLKDRAFRKSSRSLTRVVRDINFHEPAFAFPAPRKTSTCCGTCICSHRRRQCPVEGCTWPWRPDRKLGTSSEETSA